jgi:hypothetical protein
MTTRKRPDLRLVTPAKPAENIFDDLDALRKKQSAPQSGRIVRRARLKETFARIPHDRAVELVRKIGGPAWLILIELDRLILKGRGRNPVRLTNRNLKRAGVVDHTKMRALQKLEAAGVIHVVSREKGKSPLVAHLWFPLHD